MPQRIDEAIPSSGFELMTSSTALCETGDGSMVVRATTMIGERPASIAVRVARCNNVSPASNSFCFESRAATTSLLRATHSVLDGQVFAMSRQQG
jgi:hypothetical protein